ncbi:hypothetical protein AB6D15_17655 [Vibrio splendidus]
MLSTLPYPKADEVFAQTVSEVLLTEWDPIGVYDECFDEALAGEYIGYEAAVVQFAQAGDMSNLATYLLLVERHIIGMDRDNGEYLCARVAHKLVKAWQCR